jgi:hypothetical protein
VARPRSGSASLAHVSSRSVIECLYTSRFPSSLGIPVRRLCGQFNPTHHQQTDKPNRKRQEPAFAPPCMKNRIQLLSISRAATRVSKTVITRRWRGFIYLFTIQMNGDMVCAPSVIDEKGDYRWGAGGAGSSLARINLANAVVHRTVDSEPTISLACLSSPMPKQDQPSTWNRRSLYLKA